MSGFPCSSTLWPAKSISGSQPVAAHLFTQFQAPQFLCYCSHEGPLRQQGYAAGCVSLTAFISPPPHPKATLHMQVPPGMGLRLPCSGRGGNCSKLESLTQLSSSAPPQPRSLVRSPGTFPLAYKISLPPVFKHPLHTLASKLHISWGSVGCSLCSSEDWLGVPVGCRSKWAQLPLTWLHLPNSCVRFSGLSLRKLWGRQCMNSVLLSRGSVM